MDFLSVKEFFTKVLNWIASVKAWIAKPDGPSMTETELNTFLDSLNRSFRGSVDWIVEEGTDGIWTYRKWDSGIAECWGNKTGSTTFTRTWGSMYVCDTVTVNFPSGLFLATPYVVYQSNTGNSQILFNGGATTVTAVRIQAGRMTTIATSDYNFHIYAKGWWK